MQMPLLGGEGLDDGAARSADVPGVFVGTCGFSYRDWVGVLYPAATKPKEMLEIYARAFSAVEIDSTYYRVPAPATFASMAERTPMGFRFSVKLPGAATHLPADVRALPADVKEFRAALEPLAASGKLVCGLAQFPNSFKPSADAEKRLRALRKALADVPLVAEFRHRDWQAHSTLELLGELEIGWCNVDMPHFSKLLRESADVTSEIAYVRFHGRNFKQWWRPETPDLRYDYTYSAEELAPWVDRVADLRAASGVRETLAFFNNHRRGQAVRNAEQFRAMLEPRFR
ncbi:MAG: DUF72 domain-containing protein [Candidatus Eremiobacteraeota bacterium]|nr:DUF72 domain-containing protein [Candidatus Eremiobacteraeota bacterium]